MCVCAHKRLNSLLGYFLRIFAHLYFQHKQYKIVDLFMCRHSYSLILLTYLYDGHSSFSILFIDLFMSPQLPPRFVEVLFCHGYSLHCVDLFMSPRLQPQFIHLAQIWSGFQDEMVLLSVLSNILVSLEPYSRVSIENVAISHTCQHCRFRAGKTSSFFRRQPAFRLKFPAF